MNWMTCGGSEMPNVFSQENFYSSLDLPMQGGEARIQENKDDGDADVKFVLKAEKFKMTCN